MGYGSTKGGVRTKPSGGLELFAWFFMRVSGLLLVFLALGHFFVMHVIAEGVDRVNYDFVAARYATPFWRTYDLMMLTLALMHGTNGIRTLIDDYARSKGTRLFWLSTLYVISGFMLLVGGLLILTFQPVKS